MTLLLFIPMPRPSRSYYPDIALYRLTQTRYDTVTGESRSQGIRRQKRTIVLASFYHTIGAFPMKVVVVVAHFVWVPGRWIELGTVGNAFSRPRIPPKRVFEEIVDFPSRSNLVLGLLVSLAATCILPCSPHGVKTVDGNSCMGRCR